MSQLAKLDEEKKQFELACTEAEGLSLMQNAGAAFKAVIVVNNLRQALTDEVMKMVFMPLMNTKIGFLTDRTGKPNKRGQTKPLYTINEVRDCIIDAASFGLLPTFNQFNILAGRMYPTKEGYTSLLKKIKCQYILNVGQDSASNDANEAIIPVKINYQYRGEKNSFVATFHIPKYSTDGSDQLKGKAERRAKKQLYEYVTGLDLGEVTEEGTATVIPNDRTPADEKVIEQEDNSEESTETVKI